MGQFIDSFDFGKVCVQYLDLACVTFFVIVSHDLVILEPNI